MLEEVNKLTEIIIGSAIEAHKELGPGLLESAYQACLLYELVQRGLKVQPQFELPIHYKGVHLDCGYKIDLLVEGQVIVEIKSVEKIHPIHEAQLLSYLRLATKQVGLLINFNVTQLVKGVKRKVI